VALLTKPNSAQLCCGSEGDRLALYVDNTNRLATNWAGLVQTV